MMEHLQKICLPVFVFLMFLNACGPEGPDVGVGGGGAIAICVRGADAFNPNIEHGRVEKYRVVVRGKGIEGRMGGEFPGDTDEGVIEDVPAGEDRVVIVEAENANGSVIRAGEATGVHTGGGVTEVFVDLESVPIFANLREGGIVHNTRLAMRIFSDPSHPVVVLDVSDTENLSLVDAATNSREIYADEATWLGSFSPAILPAGGHRFIVSDLSNGRSSEINLMLIDGEDMRPAPFMAACAPGKALSSLIMPIAGDAHWR